VQDGGAKGDRTEGGSGSLSRIAPCLRGRGEALGDGSLRLSPGECRGPRKDSSPLPPSLQNRTGSGLHVLRGVHVHERRRLGPVRGDDVVRGRGGRRVEVDGELCHTRLLREQLPPELLDYWLRRRILSKLFVLIVVVNVIPDPDKLLVAV